MDCSPGVENKNERWCLHTSQAIQEVRKIHRIITYHYSVEIKHLSDLTLLIMPLDYLARCRIKACWPSVLAK